MTGRNSAEERISRWLTEEAQGELPDWVLRETFVRTRALHQAGIRPPWRFFEMPRSMRLVAVGAAAIALLAIGLILGVGRGPAPVSQPSPSPSAAPTSTLDDPSGWTPFVSDRHGITLRFPPGWNVVKATAPWIWQAADPGPSDAATDRAVGPENQALVVASQRLPDAMSEDAWWAGYLSADTTGMPAGCFPSTRANYEPIRVGGHAGYLHGGLSPCNFTEVIVIVDTRAYQLTAYANVSVPSGGVFDRAVFDAWLSTVVFDPASAVDTPSEASPSAT